MHPFKKNIRYSLIKKVEKTISEYGMLDKNDSVLVGVSGGADSVALVHLLCEMAPLFSLKIGIAHLNHSLRGNDSDKDAGFVTSLSDMLHLPCFIEKTDVLKYKTEHSLSLEEAGRRVRYAFFENVALKEGFNKVALGHTVDDNAELILMYLIRGSGPLGISGIPPVRSIFNTKLFIIRPLIKTARYDIMKYISENDLQYVVDKSNTDLKYLRNRIRHKLIPELTENYNPKTVETINRLASVTRSEDEWMENQLESVFSKNIMLLKDKRIVLSVSGIISLHPAAKRRITRSAIEKVKGDLRGISYSHTELVSDQLLSGSDSWSLDLPDRIRITRNGNELVISKEEENLRKIQLKNSVNNKVFFEYVVHKPGLVIAEKEGFNISFSEIDHVNLSDISLAGEGTAYFDVDKTSFPFIIRNYQHGESFKPLGMQGSQKISKYLINNKVPRENRAKIPVVISNDKIIWLAGFVIDDSVKVTPDTGKILKAELSLA
jgi:tRNA(Ile)-lysidine synthase